MNDSYWKNYYKKNKTQKPSQFFEFCKKRIKKTDVVLDFAAGDGRDTYPMRHICNKAIYVEPNNEIIDTIGFDSVHEISNEIKIDVIYARWALHAIDLKTEDELIEFAVENKAKIFAEFRTDEDNPDDTHERRLINPYEFQEKLKKKGFKINDIKIGYGFSKVGNEDPHLCRIICEYQGR